MDALCLELIFSYSLSHHVFSVCSLVCREWSDLVRSRDFFKRYSKLLRSHELGPFYWIEMMSCVDNEFYELISTFVYSVKAEKCPILPNHIRITIPSSDQSEKYVFFYDCELKQYRILQDENSEMIPYQEEQTNLVDLVKKAKIVSASVSTTTMYGMGLMHDHTECKQDGLEWFLQQQLKYFNHIPTNYFFSILDFHANPSSQEQFRNGKFALGGDLLAAMKHEKIIPYSMPKFKHFNMSEIANKASNFWNYPYERALERLFCRGKLKKDLGIKLIQRGFDISIRTLISRSDNYQLVIDLLIEFCKVNEIDLLREIAMKDNIKITNSVQMIYYFTCCVFQIPAWLYSPTHLMIDYLKTLDSNIHFPFASKCEIPLENPNVCLLMKNSFQETPYGRIKLDRLTHITKDYVSSMDIQIIEKDPADDDELINQMGNYDCIIYCVNNLEKTIDKQEKGIDYNVLKYLEKTGKRICFMMREEDLREFYKSPIPYLKHVNCGLLEFDERNIHTLITGSDTDIEETRYKGTDPRPPSPSNNDEEEDEEEYYEMFY